jgi:hypothetical protein
MPHSVVPNSETIRKPTAYGRYTGLWGEEGQENPLAFVVYVTGSIQHVGGDRVSYVQQRTSKKAPRSGEVG